LGAGESIERLSNPQNFTRRPTEVLINSEYAVSTGIVQGHGAAQVTP